MLFGYINKTAPVFCKTREVILLEGCTNVVYGIRKCILLLPAVLMAFWTLAFHDERDRVGQKTFGQVYLRNGHVLQAVGMLAVLAVEMQMPMLMVLCLSVLAQLVMHHTASVFKSVYHIMLCK